MNVTRRSARTMRWILSVALVVAGLSTTWAWGQVARMAEPPAPQGESVPATLYAAWQPAGVPQRLLFRSGDEGATWQPVALPEDGAPVTWADDGADQVAVTLEDGTLLRSTDRGATWTVVARDVPALSLTWGDRTLFVGTDGRGIYRLTADGSLASDTRLLRDLGTVSVRKLAFVDGRLFALTPTALFYTDDSGQTWERFASLPRFASALAATGKETVFVGTEIEGIFGSVDLGESWQSVREGLGLAPGLWIEVSALEADPQEPGVLYAAVNYVTGATQLHTSAAGVFLTVDGGAVWQRLAGPAFPEAEEASALIVASGMPLHAGAVTARGLQSYAPDVAGALAALKQGDAGARAAAARLLGLAGVEEATGALVAALADPDPAVSFSASVALGRIGDPATVAGLLVALEHPSEEVRQGATRALGMMRVDAAVPPLRAMVLRGDGASLAVAAEALGRIGSQSAAEALIVALADPELTPRRHAALGALEAMGTAAVEPLAEALSSDDPYARANAAEALGWIGSPAATDALVRALRGDASETVRTQAAWALGEIGDPAARAALERAAARDAAASVQAEAGLALARLETPSALAAGRVESLAAALNRLQPLRWLILALSLLGAAWIGLGRGTLTPAPAVRVRRHG